MSKDTVSLRDIYDAIEKLEHRIGERFERIEGRVSIIEAFQNKALGVLTIVTAFISVAATYVWNKVTGDK